MLSFFPLDVLDDILDLIESVSEGFLTYFSNMVQAENKQVVYTYSVAGNAFHSVHCCKDSRNSTCRIPSFVQSK